jgi:K+/H+ antiporter YhaU regulatory subunit KhtT
MAQLPDNTQRLERMEQAIDSIAIEMERVSEGQRFVTRLLSESRGGAAIEAQRGGVQPLSIPVGEKSAPRY